MRQRVIKEDSILTCYFDWVRVKANQDFRYKYIIHIPNEAKRTKWGHVRAVEKGLSKGMLDVIGLHPPMFAMEFKSAKGKVTREQAIWLCRLKSVGVPCAVVRSFEEAKTFTEKWLG